MAAMRGRTWLAGLVLAPMIGCGAASGPSEPPLRVAAASDLQAVLPELAAAFERTGGGRVEFVLGSSGNLARQVAQGAPFDLFLSADRRRVEELAEGGAIDRASVRPYAVGSLALAVHGDAAATIRGLEDLRRPEVKKLALANPEFAPYGAAARVALQSAGLWDELQPKVVLAETVRQALQFVQTGNADAGLVGRAIAEGAGVEVRPIDPGLYDPIVQTLGVVADAPCVESARAFAAFLLGPEGQGLLARRGFRPYPGER